MIYEADDYKDLAYRFRTALPETRIGFNGQYKFSVQLTKRERDAVADALDSHASAMMPVNE